VLGGWGRRGLGRVGQVDHGPTGLASSGDERKQMGHDDGLDQNEGRKIMGCRNWFLIFFDSRIWFQNQKV
jgi:hypothetical protein